MINTQSPSFIHYMLALGGLYETQQRHPLAIKYFHKCLDGHASLYGGNSIDAAKSYLLNSIGFNYNAIGQYSDAEDYYKQSLAMYGELSQSGVSEDIANILYNLGINYHELEQYSNAEDYYIQA